MWHQHEPKQLGLSRYSTLQLTWWSYILGNVYGSMVLFANEHKTPIYISFCALWKTESICAIWITKNHVFWLVQIKKKSCFKLYNLK